MKRILYLLCFFYTLASHAQHQLYPYFDGTKWGLTNEKLDVILKPQFDNNPHIVKGNFAIVQKDSKFGVVNHKGKAILPIQYDELIDLNGETGRAALNSKYIFINFKSGRQVSNLLLDEVEDYCNCPENVVIVTQNGKKGFLNITTGKLVDGLVYEDAYFLRHYPGRGKPIRLPELAEVKKDGKYGVLNVSNGMRILDTKYDYVDARIDKGRMLIYAKIGMDRKYFDLKGNEVYVEEFAAPPEYGSSKTITDSDKEENVKATIDLYASGTIGGDGNWTVTIERTSGEKTEVLERHVISGYEFASKLYYDSAEGAGTAKIKGVKTNPRVNIVVMDIKGNVLARYDYDNIEYKQGYYETRLDGKAGVLTMDLVEIKKPILEYILDYDPANPDFNALFIQMPNGQRGYMDKKNGKIFIPGIPDK
jgi:hypothetical protein